MPAVLITGATGFVGKSLCSRMLAGGWHVRGTLLASESRSALVDGVEAAVIEPLGANTPLKHALLGIDTVIHLAARVHIMREKACDPLKEFRSVNVEGTECLARHAVSAGVRRLVFMSTIGVNGDNSGELQFTEFDRPRPHNPYSISKLEAENKLSQISSETGLEVVTVRAPLVYGPGNPGNFLSLLKVVHSGIPLPLASVANKRSLIYVRNLVDALAVCASHPLAAGKTYLVSDTEEVSTPELIRRMAVAQGATPRLLPFPVALMRMACKLMGKEGAVNRLTASLSVDSSKICSELGWKPPFTMEEGLTETAEWFKKRKEVECR